MAVQINGTTGITTPKLDALDLELGSKNVVERGSNANGDYVRYADGTQICYRIAITGQSVTANLYSNSNAMSFPAAFSNTPRVCIQRTGYPHNAGSYSLLSAESISATSCYLVVVSNTSFNYTSAVDIIAIGRWY